LVSGLVVLAFAGCVSPAGKQAHFAKQRKANIEGAFGTYSGEPRLSSGRVDIQRLLDELTDLRANTYNWLIWHASTDWEDLQEFLPLAATRHIRVWVTLVPPSESPPHTKAYSEPFRLDYRQWAQEIARLSLRHPNLVAWSLDDFSHNGKVFTAEELGAMLTGARAINPKLAFVPCIYFRHARPEFAATYAPLIDGILFPFRNESGTMDLQTFDSVEDEVRKMREIFGGDVPVFIDIYATRHSRLNDSTPEYVREVMLRGRRSADGVLIYCHQSPKGSPEKYAVMRELFNSWSAKP